MKYLVDDKTFDNIDDTIDWCIDDDFHRDDYQSFETWVNDTYGSLDVAGCCFNAYDILQSLAPDLLNDLIDDFCRDEDEYDRENARYELTNAEHGTTVWIQSKKVEVVDNEPVNVEEVMSLFQEMA